MSEVPPSFFLLELDSIFLLFFDDSLPQRFSWPALYPPPPPHDDDVVFLQYGVGERADINIPGEGFAFEEFVSGVRGGGEGARDVGTHANVCPRHNQTVQAGWGFPSLNGAHLQRNYFGYEQELCFLRPPPLPLPRHEKLSPALKKNIAPLVGQWSEGDNTEFNNNV